MESFVSFKISLILGKWRTPECMYYLVRWLDSHTDTWERTQLVNTFEGAVKEGNDWLLGTGQESKIRRRGGFRPEARDTTVPHHLTEAMLSNVVDKPQSKASNQTKAAKPMLNDSMTSSTSNEEEGKAGIGRRQIKKEVINGDTSPKRQSPRTSPKGKQLAKAIALKASKSSPAQARPITAASKLALAPAKSSSAPVSPSRSNMRMVRSKNTSTAQPSTPVAPARKSSARTLISSDRKRAPQAREVRKRTATVPFVNVDEPRPKRSKAGLRPRNDSFEYGPTASTSKSSAGERCLNS